MEIGSAGDETAPDGSRVVMGRSFSTVEMPERAQRFQVRQRNYEVQE